MAAAERLTPEELVIVRIVADDQYRLDERETDELGELDDAAVAAVEARDEQRFHQIFGEMVRFVRERGEPVPADELIASDLILPPADLSLAEAEREFTGEGLLPD